MPNVAEKLMSLDEFLAWEREQPERYEYAGGVVTMMTGGSLDHSTIASNLWTALRMAFAAAAVGLPRRYEGNREYSIRYPDLSVTCASVRGDETPSQNRSS